MKEAISQSENYELAFCAVDYPSFVSSLEQTVPDAVLMDLQLEENTSGIDCTKWVKKKFPKVEVLIFTVFEDSESVFESLKAGASGYVTKNTSPDEILKAFDEIFEGGAPMSQKIARMVVKSLQKSQLSPLTEKESQILEQLSKGASYKSIALSLSISLSTVKFHIKNIYIKLQATSKEDALEKARTNKWLL